MVTGEKVAVSTLTDEDRATIKRQFMNMRYGAGLPGTGWQSTPPFGSEIDVATILAFLDGLNDRLSKAVDEARDNQMELDQLRAQRAAMRAFLGTEES